ncbi:hypothetical protein HNQ59_003664 [Chitinivorax tropicus]|uniref:Peptidase C-terminal archaeal/bacterial domain-containing protein n=1 Tax=Chitinivorax tropicus TaxID=714531 RepID=A0A840MSF5_9PROT|nr:PPC domain-containing protein [Chitinivorax tropicus]MBB5020345.1 hypothetical protein [Chitinivorax tropicus]
MSIADDAEKRYVIDVPAGARFLAIRTGSGAGDLDLYVKADSAPTKGRNGVSDAKSRVAGNAEHVLISNPKAGRYHVLLHAYDAVKGASVVAVVR